MAVDQRNQQQSHEQQHQDAVSTEYLVHNWLEALFAWFQVIVLWHEPNVSFCAISGLLSSFLLFTYFAPRFYAIIIIAIFIYNLNKFWFRHVWPEIRVPLEGDRELEMRLDVDRWTLLHPQLMTLTELKYHIRNLMKLSEYYLQRLSLLRHQRPAAFCSLLCSVFTFTAYIGSRISGLSLIFCTLLIIMTAPGIYACLLPDRYKSWLQQHIQTLIDLAEIDESGVELSQEHDDHGKAEESQEQQQAPRSTLESTRVYKETIATSLTSTIKSIESLFDNLKRKNQLVPKSTAPVIATQPSTIEPATNSQTESHPITSVLASFREDGAKALINLIDVTLMSGNRDQPEASAATTTTTTTTTTPSMSIDSLRSQRERRRTSSDSSIVEESVPLVDPEEGDQQDDGFVIL